MMEDNYQVKTDEKRLIQIREITKTLPQTCGDFIRAISTTTTSLTRLAYAYDLRIFFQFLQQESAKFSAITHLYEVTDQMIDEITQRDLEEFVEYLTIYFPQLSSSDQPVTNNELGIMRKISTLRSFFGYLFRSKRIKSNVATLISLPKIHEKPILRLELDEIEKMLSVIETGDQLTDRQRAYQERTRVRDYAIISLFLGTGIRVSECVGINISDIDFEQNAFLVTRKGGNQVILYFPEEVSDALYAYYEERIQIEALPGHENAFFLSLQKRRITQRAVQNLVKKYASIAAPLKKKISPHKLRSTFGTNLYNETGDIYLVADVLGHADVNTTRKHYAAMTQARRKEAVKYVKYRNEVDSNHSNNDSSPTVSNKSNKNEEQK
ncbi:MAG: tyrosine-type recombinase/integrase [Clostridiales bacterium]|nr:tyrosine-type recombinase/integrase [Clostridiales bacterium]